MRKSPRFAAGVTMSLLLVGALVGSSAATAQSARPSFNCAAAKTSAERMICRDAGLARLDREIAAAYAAALKRVNAAAGAKIRQEQNLFLILRTGVVRTDHPFQSSSTPRERLGSVMEERVSQLRAIRKPSLGGALTGTWSNFNGDVVVRALGRGRFQINQDGADPYAARWVCKIEGVATQRGNKLVLDQRRSDGSLIEISRSGDMLILNETLAPKTYGSPYCGLNGGVKGSYFYTAR